MTQTALTAYWWAPRKEASLGRRELRKNAPMWLRLARGEGRLMSNFGDELNVAVISYASQRLVRWSPPEKAQVIGIGSIIEFFADRVEGGERPFVWGAGVRQGEMSTRRLERVLSAYRTISAVRGPSTLKALHLSDSDVALGDPGVLAPLVVPADGEKSGTAFLPHFRTWRSKAGRAEIKRIEKTGIAIVMPTEGYESVLRKIAGSELLVTSSLHGVIVAHAYGTPVVWVDIPGVPQASEPRFKFDDYFGSMGIPGARHSTTEIVEARPRRLLREAESSSSSVAERAAARARELLEVFPL